MNIKYISIEGVSNFEFNPNTTNYDIITNKSKLNLNIELEDSKSTYKIEGNDNLKNGDVVTIIVTSVDGKEKKYSITINKEKIKNDEKRQIPIYVFLISEVLWVILLFLYIKLLLKK